jgi:hypothetical protein
MAASKFKKTTEFEFLDDSRSVIVSTTKINKTDVEDLILDNLNEFREGSKILHLFGHHSSRKGDIEGVDEVLVCTLQSVKSKLERKHGPKLKQRNITIGIDGF